LILDGGETFDFDSPQGRMKALTLIEAMNLMGYAAMGFGDRELSYELKFLKTLRKKANFPFLSANVLERKNRIGEISFIMKLGDLKIGLLSLVSTTTAPKNPLYTKEDPLKTAARLIPKIRKKCDLLIVLAHLEQVQAESLAKYVSGIDILIRSPHPPYQKTPMKVKETILLACGSRGEYLGELHLKLSPKKKIESYEEKQVLLSGSIASDPEVNSLVQKYNEEVKKLAMAQRSQAGIGSKSSQFLTANGCEKCHKKEYEGWIKTRHAAALNSLIQKEKHYDSDCLPCHTTGFGMPGGFVNLKSSLELESVQCEACHGPGKAHAEEGKKKYGRVGEKTCKKCHTPFYSPNMDFNKEIKKGMH